MVQLTDPSVVRVRLHECRRLLTRLARSESLTNGDIDLAYGDLTEIASDLLDVARASIWRLDPLNQQLECVKVYLREQSRHDGGVRIEVESAPAFFREMSEDHCIAASCVSDDPRTSELSKGYFEPHGIGAVLAAPIWVAGRVVGVVCHEHLETDREWSFTEELLASSVADLLGRVVEVAERREAERTVAVYAQLNQLRTEEASRVRAHVAQEVEEWQRARMHGQSFEEIRRLYDASPVPLVLTRVKDGVVRYVNQRAGELFSLTPEAMVGRKAPDFYVDPDDRENFIRELQERGRVDGFVAQLKSSSGRSIWAIMSAQQMEYGGEPCFMVGFSDVSAQKVAEEAVRQSEAGIRALIEAAPVPLILSRVEGSTVVLANTKAAELFEVPFEDAVGLPTPDFYVNAEDRAAVIATLLKQGSIDNYPLQMKTATGRCLWAEMSARVIDYQGAKCFMVGIHDVTERYEATRELRHAKEQAESASRAKSTFLARMSHELRTPLNAILGFTQIIGGASNLDDEQREQLAIVRRSGKHLLDLINSVLEMSKIESGSVEVNLRAFDLFDFLKGLEESFSLRAAQKRLTLRFRRGDHLPRWIRTDEMKLRQAVINLLENAIKFTNEGGVTVAAEVVSNDGDRLRISVRDTGVGIPAAERAHVFKPFAQAQDVATTATGTGLGLSITREFARLLGGNLTLEEDAEGAGGSCFVFEIPLEHAEEQEAGQASTSRRVLGIVPGQPSRRILIVDDDDASRMLLRAVLAGVGGETLEIRDATNGDEALRTVQQWTPHLIWMDMRMPVMSGYDATRAIRRWCEDNGRVGPDRPIIVALTASSFAEEKEKIMAAGCDGFQRKPIDVAEIFDNMTKFLGLRFEYEPDGERPAVPTAGPSVESQDDFSPSQAAERTDVDADTSGAFDIAAALKRLGGNRPLLHKVMTSFITKYDRMAEEIDAALRAGDRGAARRLAHTLKGLAGNVGAEEVVRRALQLERLIDDGQSDLDGPQTALVRSMKRAIAFIDELLKEEDTGAH